MFKWCIASIPQQQRKQRQKMEKIDWVYSCIDFVDSEKRKEKEKEKEK